MKKLVFALVAISLAFISCDNGAKKRQAEAEEAEKARQDSIAKAKEEEKARFVFEDSVAIFAWGDAKFGMTKKEVLQTKAFSDADKYDDSFSMDFDKEIAIKRSLGLKRWPNIWIDFGGKTKNEVTRIRISGSVEWKNFEELIHDMKQMIKKFKSKYGKPDGEFEYIANLQYQDLDKYNSISVANWIIGSGKGNNGTKYINITASTYTSTSYKYDIVIYNSDYPKQPKEMSQKEIQEAKERAQKEKDAVENSF